MSDILGRGTRKREKPRMMFLTWVMEWMVVPLRWEPQVCRGNGRFVLACAESKILGGAWIQGTGAQRIGAGVRVTEIDSVFEFMCEEDIHWPRGTKRMGSGQKIRLEGIVILKAKKNPLLLRNHHPKHRSEHNENQSSILTNSWFYKHNRREA